MTKELKTHCITFDASAVELKHAIETEAIESGVGLDAVRVTRSGDMSFSSNYGYSYMIEFIGGNLRGNTNQFMSDAMLSGRDALGGSTCEAFNSPTDDASINILTENESEAIGTDTPRTNILVTADYKVEEGQFELSVMYLGETKTTSCIEWNADAAVLKSIIEELSNVDSVRVDRSGIGSLTT